MENTQQSDVLLSQAENSEIDLGRLFNTLWRGKFWIAFFAMLGLLAGYYSFSVAVPMYRATSVIMLENRQSQVVDLESVVSGLSADQATVNTELEVLRARGLFEKLVIELNLTDDPEFNSSLRPKSKSIRSQIKGKVRELILGPKSEALGPKPEATAKSSREILDATIDRVLPRVTVSNSRQSYVFRVVAQSESAEKSALIANTLAKLYINDQLDVKRQATEQATNWLGDRVSDLRIDLERTENAVKEFNSDSDLISAESLAALDRQFKELRDRSLSAKTAADNGRAFIQTLQSTAQSEDRVAKAQAANSPILKSLAERAEKGDARSVQAFDVQFENFVREAIRDQTRKEDQAVALAASMRALEQRILDQSEDLLELQQLRREAEANRLLYEYFLTRLKETSVQQGIQKADSRLLSEAVVPNAPSFPRKTRILALGLLLGLFAGIALVISRELLRTGIRTAEDLERVSGRTVMGQIPKIPTRRRKNVIKYFVDRPNSAAAEAIRNLRTSILLASLDKPPKVIMVTSGLPGEGKTTQSLALAQNFSGLGQKVLLIEGDIRRRVFSQYFDIPSEYGMLSVLSGEKKLDEVLAHSSDLGVDILIGEKSSTNAADVFSSKAFKSFLDDVREKYDAVIIDTPPVLVVPDARVIGQSVDAIIYSVKWDTTTRTQVREGMRLFETVNLKVTGLALTQIDAKGMRRYGYGDSYGAYGAYGSKYYNN